MTNGLAGTGAPASEPATGADRPAGDRKSADRDVLARVAASSFGRGAGPGVQRPSEETKPRIFARGWKRSLLLDLLLVAAPLPLVLIVPPYLDCRERHAKIGFFAGESMYSCTRKGVSERWRKLDSRLKMLVRNSGH